MQKKCAKASKCNAPLCPLDEESLRHGVWYPGEEVCRKSKYQFIKTQKKIQRALSPEDDGLEYGYFTFRMLNRNMRVTHAIRGLNPEKDEKKQLTRWEKIHPHRVLSEDRKKELADRFRKYVIRKKSEEKE